MSEKKSKENRHQIRFPVADFDQTVSRLKFFADLVQVDVEKLAAVVIQDFLMTIETSLYSSDVFDETEQQKYLLSTVVSFLGSHEHHVKNYLSARAEYFKRFS